MKPKAVWCFAGAGVSAVLLAAVVSGYAAGGPLATNLALVFSLGALVLVLATVGVNFLLSAEGGASGEEKPVADYRHTARLFVFLGVCACAAMLARTALVPEGFGLYGFYRGAAPSEAMGRAPRHLGEAACADCHDGQVGAHDKDAHGAIQCETCHGPGWLHVEQGGARQLAVPKGKGPCLACHLAMAARPSHFPQVEWREHYSYLGVVDESVECTRCHDPHQPLFMDRDLRQARLHPLIYRCRDCHRDGRSPDATKPPDHPAIFECSYCHKALVEDFKARSHNSLECTTCHSFVRESDFAGRIVRDSDPRFCLLCHRQTDFRSGGTPPLIPWPGHMKDVGAGPRDQEKRCVDCHLNRIHAPGGAKP